MGGRPRPIRTEAGLAVAIGSAGGLAALWGVAAGALRRSVGAVALVAAVVAAVVLLVARAEARVTPVSDPRDDDGHDLVPVLTAEELGMPEHPETDGDEG